MPPPATSEPRTAAWLVQEVTGARILEAAQLRPYMQEFKAAGAAGDAAALADFLARTGLLTPFQADRVLAGEAAKLVLGPYLLSGVIGTGSLGTVFQAVGRSDRQRYAVKVLPLRSLWNVHLAKKQVEAFADLPPHPAVVPFVDIGSAGGSHYLVWPFAEGVTLGDAVARAGRLAVGEAVRVATQVADGLAVCHPRGIIHGLLKPSNVLLGTDGQPRILDLGVGAILSENMADDESMLDTISTANAAMGMLDCCAPETVVDPQLRTPAGDLYSLGCVLYFVLAGSLPFPAGTAVEKVIAHQTREPPPVARQNPAVPAWLADLVGALLRKDPAARPASAAAVAATLKAGAVPAGPTLRPALVPRAQTPMLTAPAPRPLPPAAKANSLIDFDLPDAEATDPGFVLGEVPTPRRSADETAGHATGDLGFRPPPGPVPEPPRPVFITSPPPPAPPGVSVTAATPPPAAPPPRPPFLRRLARRLAFWLPPADQVQLSVFGPPAVAPGANIFLQVFAHTPGAFESVRTLSRAFHQDGELLATGFVHREVVRGDELGLHLAVANAGVGRSLLQLNWLGQPQPRSFEVHVPWESPTGLTVGVLSAGLGGVMAGRVEFRIKVLPRRG